METSGSSIITALGAGSGVDFTQLAQDISAASFALQRDSVTARQSQLEAQISAAGQLRGAITDLAAALGDRIRGGDLAPTGTLANSAVAAVSVPAGLSPRGTYRRVALEARIEASGSAELTRICLEEAAEALAQALLARERTGAVPAEPLTRAQTIMVWLAQSVAPDHPLQASLKAFYGGLAGQIGAQVLHAEPAVLAAIRQDICDVLEAAG